MIIVSMQPANQRTAVSEEMLIGRYIIAVYSVVSIYKQKKSKCISLTMLEVKITKTKIYHITKMIKNSNFFSSNFQ